MACLTKTQFVLCCYLLLLGLFSGCVSEKKERKAFVSSDSGDGTIQEINLLAIPVALNFDQAPGPDGFVIKVYAGNRKRPKPFPIENGSIEVLMYDGIPGITESATAKPRRTWAYTAADLKPYQIQSSIGTGYQLAQLWGDAKPASEKISVLVRYTPLTGRTISSAPSIIAVR